MNGLPSVELKKIEMIVWIKDIKSLIHFFFFSIFAFTPFQTKYKYKCRMCNFEFN
jgi:hypothetical protein